MSRSLSAAARLAMFAQETSEVYLLLLTIDHATLSVPIRVVRDLQGLVSGGNTFAAFPFEVTLPAERDDQVPRIRLTIDNVDRTIVQAVRRIPPTSPPTVTVDIVLASQPNTIEATYTGFTMRNVSYDALVVEGDLLFEDVLGAATPKDSFSPNIFQGLF